MTSTDMSAWLSADLSAVARIDSIPWVLKTLCDTTGLGFAVVARVTEGSWTACAVEDRVSFGLKPGGQLELRTTLCREVQEGRVPIAIDHASQDDVYRHHPTPKLYAFESYVSVPIELPSGDYFGNLCALDPRPADVANERVLTAFQQFARLIAFELENQRRMTDLHRQLLDEETLGAQREQFMAILAHDLRTPLSSIAACGQILAVKGTDAVAANLSKRIGTSVRRMVDMIEDLLDLARSKQGGGIKVVDTDIDGLGAALETVIDELRVAHPGRALISTLRIERPVAGDKRRLQQLVSNLVGNALTHGSQAAPIEVSATTVGEEFRLEVHNQGLPIPPDSIAGIFDAYSQAAAAGLPRDGLGLGLYISRQVVEAHGGTLEVASSDAGGTTFTATIPLKNAYSSI